MNLHQHTKYQFIPSIHSWDTVNFRVPWLDWPHPLLTMPNHKIFDQYLIYSMWTCIHMQKIRLFHSSVTEIWLIKKSCNLIGWEHFGPYLRNKNFPYYSIAQEHSKYMFSLLNKFSKNQWPNFVIHSKSPILRSFLVHFFNFLGKKNISKKFGCHTQLHMGF